MRLDRCSRVHRGIRTLGFPSHNRRADLSACSTGPFTRSPLARSGISPGGRKSAGIAREEEHLICARLSFGRLDVVVVKLAVRSVLVRLGGIRGDARILHLLSAAPRIRRISDAARDFLHAGPLRALGGAAD